MFGVFEEIIVPQEKAHTGSYSPICACCLCCMFYSGLQHWLRKLQLQLVDLAVDLDLSLAEQKLLVVPEVLLASVFVYECCT